MQQNTVKTALFEEIFYSTKDKLYVFVKKLIRDESMVQDHMQTCYMKLWEAMDKIDTTKEVIPFLYAISRNIVIDHLRKTSRIQYMETLPDNTGTGANITENYIREKEGQQRIHALIQKMPAKQRLVFTLIKLNGLNYQQVAQEMNISISTVEKHMHAAYKVFSRKQLTSTLLVLLTVFNKY